MFNFGCTLESLGNLKILVSRLYPRAIKSESLGQDPGISCTIANFESFPDDSNVQQRWRNCSDGLFHLSLSVPTAISLVQALLTFSIFYSVLSAQARLSSCL